MNCIKSSVGSDCLKGIKRKKKKKTSGMLYAGGLKNGDLCTTRDLLTQKAGESNEKDRNGKRKKK